MNSSRNLSPTPTPAGLSGQSAGTPCVSCATAGDEASSSAAATGRAAAAIRARSLSVGRRRGRPPRGSGRARPRGDVGRDDGERVAVEAAGRRAPTSRRTQITPVGRWAGGPVGRWAGGPVGRWAGGPVGRWAGGLIVPAEDARGSPVHLPTPFRTPCRVHSAGPPELVRTTGLGGGRRAAPPRNRTDGRKGNRPQPPVSTRKNGFSWDWYQSSKTSNLGGVRRSRCATARRSRAPSCKALEAQMFDRRRSRPGTQEPAAWKPDWLFVGLVRRSPNQQFGRAHGASRRGRRSMAADNCTLVPAGPLGDSTPRAPRRMCPSPSVGGSTGQVDHAGRAYLPPGGGRRPCMRARCTASRRPRAPSFAKMPEMR